MKPVREEVLRMAEKVGMYIEDGEILSPDGGLQQTTEIINLVALAYEAGARAEREKCANACESLIGSLDISGGHALIAAECAKAIRARTTP